MDALKLVRWADAGLAEGGASMAGWLRRVTACGLVFLLAISQSLVPSIALAQQAGSFQGEMQIRVILEGEAVEGEITASDLNTDGVYFDMLVFAGYAGDRVTITIAPNRMTGILTIADTDGDTIGELEFAPNSPVRSLRVPIPEDGAYLVLVGSESGGPYSVTLSSMDNSGDVDPTSGLGDINLEMLQFGQWHEGELEESDAISGDGEGIIVDLYAMEGPPGQRYRVTVESDAFDPVLIISTTPGEDPRMEFGRDGRLVVRERFNSEGFLTLGVTTADGQLGSYRIIVEREGQR